jgi:folate-binding protein YgfZ
MCQILHHDVIPKVARILPEQPFFMSIPSPSDRTFSALRISGSERISFLQGQLTQDLTLLRPEAPLLAGWNSAKGRLLCICMLADWQESTWMLLPSELAPEVARKLGMYVLRADVRIETSPLSVTLTGSIQTDNNDVNHCYMDDYFQIKTAPGASLTVGDKAVTELTSGDWRRQHILNGVPWVWHETTEQFVPQMLNLDLLGAISFTKGCYVGQEIVARTQNLGRIKRRMYGFRTSHTELIAPGTTVFAGTNNVGQVVDAVPGANSTDLLAVIRIEALAEKLTVQDPNGILLQPVALPYEVPETI